MAGRSKIETLMAQVEEMWGHQDTLFEQIEETDQWDRQHGKDWTFVDVPYHLAYCNRDLVARPIRLGKVLPAGEQRRFTTIAEINDWNAEKFHVRPAGQTAEEALAALHASWDEIRDIVGELTDENLQDPYWSPFMGGNWLTVRDGLLWSLAHDWSEFMQLRIHMGLDQPVPSPAISSHYLGVMIGGIFPLSLDKEAAQGKEFRAVMSFTDPGVSASTIEVQDGLVGVKPGQVEGAELHITQSAETFEKTLRGIETMPEAMAAGAVLVNDFQALATFGELFPMNTT